MSLCKDQLHGMRKVKFGYVMRICLYRSGSRMNLRFDYYNTNIYICNILYTVYLYSKHTGLNGF